MGIREWEEVPKTDKVPLVQKGKKCNDLLTSKKQVGAVNRD